MSRSSSTRTVLMKIAFDAIHPSEKGKIFCAGYSARSIVLCHTGMYDRQYLVYTSQVGLIVAVSIIVVIVCIILVIIIIYRRHIAHYYTHEEEQRAWKECMRIQHLPLQGVSTIRTISQLSSPPLTKWTRILTIFEGLQASCAEIKQRVRCTSMILSQKFRIRWKSNLFLA
ncbi:hypothetical protein CEXT_328761 [Caerostris extrusa]|uniref:Uncharacterized protein n=1 Tax=Caerostris extrusa TaxID=172846 RepID=A0AAV4PXA7_CAEEX|nr:hypothetical protein CEXT_328761 [Caerostris extrusa]